MLYLVFGRQRSLTLVLALLALFSLTPVQAAKAAAPSLATQLQDLVTQGSAVDTQLAGISLTTSNSCTELGSANTSVGDWLAATDTVYAGITTALSIDLETLVALDDLSNLSVSIAARTKVLSQDLGNLAVAADLFEYEASLAAMLVLSDDIGTMADRIGEMADRILVMADNIGVMADRIIITQQLQTTNIVLTQASLLTTQQNVIALSDSIDTLGYNVGLAGLVNDVNALNTSMGGVTLTETNMDTELATVETDIGLYLSQVDTLYGRIIQDSAIASQYTDGDTLTMLGDLSSTHKALAVSLEGYASAVNTLAPATSIPVLSSAVDSMLRLSRDIGVMSDRIIEMADRIIVMADNIGIMSTRIVDTQTLQQGNADLTQASLLTATNVTVGVISANGL